MTADNEDKGRPDLSDLQEHKLRSLLKKEADELIFKGLVMDEGLMSEIRKKAGAGTGKAVTRTPRWVFFATVAASAAVLALVLLPRYVPLPGVESVDKPQTGRVAGNLAMEMKAPESAGFSEDAMMAAEAASEAPADIPAATPAEAAIVADKNEAISAKAADASEKERLASAGVPGFLVDSVYRSGQETQVRFRIPGATAPEGFSLTLIVDGVRHGSLDIKYSVGEGGIEGAAVFPPIPAKAKSAELLMITDTAAPLRVTILGEEQN